MEMKTGFDLAQEPDTLQYDIAHVVSAHVCALFEKSEEFSVHYAKHAPNRKNNNVLLSKDILLALKYIYVNHKLVTDEKILQVMQELDESDSEDEEEIHENEHEDDDQDEDWTESIHCDLCDDMNRIHRNWKHVKMNTTNLALHSIYNSIQRIETMME